jgi:hypothetical protein
MRSQATCVPSGGPCNVCRMDLPGPTTSVGTRTDYSVGPWNGVGRKDYGGVVLE